MHLKVLFHPSLLSSFPSLPASLRKTVTIVSQEKANYQGSQSVLV